MAKQSFRVKADINKVQTLADMGLRVTLDLPENAVPAASRLMELRRAGIEVTVTFEWEYKHLNSTGAGSGQADDNSE